MAWSKTANRFVAFFDIMGFKNRVSSTQHSSIIKLMERLATLVMSMNTEKFGHTDSQLKTTIFSDSIILITEDNSIKSAAHLMYRSGYLMRQAILLEVPLKGCISYGKFTADFEKSLFIGQPLIDAFLLQEELYLYSIVLHHSFENFMIDKTYGKKKFPANPRWTQHVTPFKNGKSKHYHLNWTFYSIKDLKRKQEFQKHLQKFYSTVSGRTRTYVDNTFEIFDKMTNEIQES